MKVKELIEKLKTIDPDINVIFFDGRLVRNVVLCIHSDDFPIRKDSWEACLLPYKSDEKLDGQQ